MASAMPENCSASDASGHNAARSASHAPSRLPAGAVICMTSAELALKMDLREPQERENEAPDAKPEHDDNHLAKPKVPRSVREVCGDRCHQINVADNRQRQERHH